MNISNTNNLKGIFWAITSSFWVAILLINVRYLSADYNHYIIVFWRCIFGLILIMPWAFRNGLHNVKTKKIKLLFFRSIIGVIAMLTWFEALSLIELPKATALSFAGPLYGVITAYFILNDKPGIHRVLALLVGLIGVMIIIRPGFIEINKAVYLILFSTFLWSIISIIIKVLTRTEASKLITFYMGLLMSILSFPLAIMHWQQIANEDWIYFILIGLTSNLAHNALNNSFKYADISVIMPFDFARLIFVSILAYFIFGDILDIWTILGTIIIVSSSCYIIFREKRNKRLTQT
jgi:drug/metabolite transporter (DMT)-like permease